jgi:hypothetical protein
VPEAEQIQQEVIGELKERDELASQFALSNFAIAFSSSVGQAIHCKTPCAQIDGLVQRLNRCPRTLFERDSR